MPYTSRFTGTDNLITNLQPTVAGVTNAAVLANYAGFLSVSAITVYELAIKDIFNDFAIKKNKVFGAYVQNHFSRINGRIQIDDLKKNQIKPFGTIYFDRFKKKLDQKESSFFRLHRISIKSNYTNLITCRHDFVHQGTPTLTFTEVIDAYNFGKEVIHCLFETMKR